MPNKNGKERRSLDAGESVTVRDPSAPGNAAQSWCATPLLA